MLKATDSTHIETLIDTSILWRPNRPHIDVLDKEAIKAYDFEKDPKRLRLHPMAQHATIVKILLELNAIPKDVANAQTLTEPKDVMAACRFAEERGYQSYASLGRLAIALDEAGRDEKTHPMAIAIGDVWDRDAASLESLDPTDLPKLTKALKRQVKAAFESIEAIEDAWDDAKGDDARAKNEGALRAWIDTATIPIVQTIRKIHHLLSNQRKSYENKEEASQYKSVGEALKAGDIPEFARLLKIQDFDVKNHPENEESVQKLMKFAFDKGHIAAFKPLSETGMTTHVVDDDGQTFISRALFKGDVNAAKALFDAGFSSRHKDLSGINELVSAIRSGSLDAVQFAVETLGLDSKDDDHGVNHEDVRGRTPLIFAVSDENEAIVTYLLSKGANPHHVTFMGETVDEFTDTQEIEALLANATSQGKRKSPKI